MLYQAVLLLAAIAYVEVIRQDWKYRRIPNLLSIFITLLAFVRLIAAGNLAYVGWSAMVAVIIFIISAFFFARGWLGGGDVKLIAVSSLLIGYRDTYQFLVYMALAGGLLSIVLLAAKMMRLNNKNQKSTVPYGIAISLSAMFVLIMQYRQRLG